MRWHRANEVTKPLAENTDMSQESTHQEPESESEAEDRLTSRDLLAEAESKEDAQESLYAGEVFLLRKIAETSSDLVKGRHWEKFREAMGGMEPLEKDHAAAVAAWEQWVHDGDDSQ